jgi:hypothetical protein
MPLDRHARWTVGVPQAAPLCRCHYIYVTVRMIACPTHLVFSDHEQRRRPRGGALAGRGRGAGAGIVCGRATAPGPDAVQRSAAGGWWRQRRGVRVWQPVRRGSGVRDHGRGPGQQAGPAALVPRHRRAFFLCWSRAAHCTCAAQVGDGDGGADHGRGWLRHDLLVVAVSGHGGGRQPHVQSRQHAGRAGRALPGLAVCLAGLPRPG